MKTNWKIARFVLTTVIVDGFYAALLHFVVTTSDASKFFQIAWLYVHMPTVNWASGLLLQNVSNYHETISPVAWMMYYLACLCQTAFLAFVGSELYFWAKSPKRESKGSGVRSNSN